MTRKKTISAVLIKTSVVLRVSGIRSRAHRTAIVSAMAAVRAVSAIDKLVARSKPVNIGDGLAVDEIVPTGADFEYGVEEHSGPETDMEVTWYVDGNPREDICRKCGHECELLKAVDSGPGMSALACPNCGEVLR